MKRGNSKVIPGINIQWPVSRLILGGQKTIETRKYPLPERYKGKEMAIVETPGPKGKKAGILHARIIGTIVFRDSFRYKSMRHWSADCSLHCVPAGDPQFNYVHGEEKWGWLIEKVIAFPKPIAAPKKKGIVYVTDCVVPD